MERERADRLSSKNVQFSFLSRFILGRRYSLRKVFQLFSRAQSYKTIRRLIIYAPSFVSLGAQISTYSFIRLDPGNKMQHFRINMLEIEMLN